MIVICSGLAGIKYCGSSKKKKRSQGCGIFIPENILQAIGVNIGDCLYIYRHTQPQQRKLILTPMKQNIHGYKLFPNPTGRDCNDPDAYKIREPMTSRFGYGGVVRFPEDLAGDPQYDLKTNCQCRYTINNPLRLIQNQNFSVDKNNQLIEIWW